MRGGKRPGSGRKRGQSNSRSRDAAERVHEAAAAREELEEAVHNGATPLEYMLAVLRDKKTDWKRRDDMAKAAAPYIHARLAAIEHSGGLTISREVWLEHIGQLSAQGMGDAEIAAELAALQPDVPQNTH